jgi:malic enzyme
MMRDVMIWEGLSEQEATGRFWTVDSRGLLTDDYTGALRDFQQRYARPAAEVATWPRQQGDPITLADVVASANPTMLIGNLHPARRIYRGHRAADGIYRGSAHDHAAVQPDVESRTHRRHQPRCALLPPVTDLRTVSAAVAIAVPSAAVEEDLAQQPLTEPVKQIHQAMWRRCTSCPMKITFSTLL